MTDLYNGVGFLLHRAGGSLVMTGFNLNGSHNELKGKTHPYVVSRQTVLMFDKRRGGSLGEPKTKSIFRCIKRAFETHPYTNQTSMLISVIPLRAGGVYAERER
jgi:hypothetical protein